MERFLQKINRHFYVLIFLAATVFFYALLYVFNVQTDIQKHVSFAQEMLRGENFPATFLYFIAVALVALFRDDYQTLLFASLVVLSFAVAWKYQITVQIFAGKIREASRLGENKIYLISNVAGLCLITAFCLYLPKEAGLTEYFLLGQISPNIWHNSTTIFLIPFALLLYWRSFKLLKEFEINEFWWVMLLVLLNLITKPNFFLCLVIAFPLAALLRYRLQKEFFLCLIPPIFGGVLLILQYVAIYQLGAYGYGKPEESGLAIAPFAWWSLYTKNIFVSFLLSAAFPLGYLIFYFKRIISRQFIFYAYLLFAFGLMILIFLTETGVRETHGNFQWGAAISSYILFVAVALDFVRHWLQTKALNLKDKIIAAIFALHVISGWLYLIKTLIRGNYG